MKTILKILPLYLLVISCNDIIEQEPIGILDASAYLNDVADAEQAVNAAYEYLLINNNNNNFYWVFGTVASDNAISGGDGSRRGIEEIDFMEQTPRTEELNDFWKLNYGGIIQANIVIEGVPDVAGDENRKNQIIGEALFLRAWYHFQLAQVFGAVPLITTVQEPDEVIVPRNSLEEVYTQIIQDCSTAANALPQTSVSQGRATKGAALALKAKTELYQQNWEAVITTTADIKNLGQYDLTTNYNANFVDSLQDNEEIIWSIQHANLELGVGNNLNQWWTSKKVTDGYGFAEITEDFAASFESGDPRLGFNIAQNGDEYLGLVYKRSFSSTGFGPQKYLQAVPTAVSQISDGAVDYPAIRFAEVLLWEAEALIELGRGSEALIPIERIRARARNQALDPENTLPPITTSDQQELKTLLQNERRVELGLEFHRFFDLVRWGIAADRIEGFQLNKNEVFPIPQTEIDLNPMLTQNAGY